MINNYKKFLEAISGTELVGKHMGPNYPEQESPVSLKGKDTEVIYSELFDKIITYDQYQDLYFNYLKKGGSPLHGFTKENLEKVLDIKESISNDETVITIDEVKDYFLDIMDSTHDVKYTVSVDYEIKNNSVFVYIKYDNYYQVWMERDINDVITRLKNVYSIKKFKRIVCGNEYKDIPVHGTDRTAVVRDNIYLIKIIVKY